ncbi:MAG: elongation factor Ts [Chloroflexi bacterium RBG_16_58_8]|nr:MAG: elongation factor Ts [Chloroflexi bacterium RBG_16_58_8]
MIKELRETSGAGVMECRSALISCGGDIEKALAKLRERGLVQAQKKAERVTGQGLVDAYIHTAGRIGAMVEVNCETDFVARTDEFKSLAHCLAMQVAALNPKYISEEQVPPGEEVDPKEACLLSQLYIRDPAITIKDLIAGTIAKTGENIRVRRFVRYELSN